MNVIHEKKFKIQITITTFQIRNMKKILFLLLLLFPLFASAQNWFKANAVCYGANGSEFSEWKKCDINVFFEGGTKVKIYATDLST